MKRPEERGRLDGLLRAWAKVRREVGEVGVVSWRGVVTKCVLAFLSLSPPLLLGCGCNLDLVHTR